jgi:triosephosphate isomerase
MRTKLVAGNWKMNGSLAANEALVKSISGELPTGCEGAIFCPAPYLPQLQGLLSGTRWAYGSQDISAHESGAYTGEISVSMVREFGGNMTLVGHSERRTYHAESSQAVASKAHTAITHGLCPVVCVGETLSERESGLTFEVIASQLDPVIEALSAFAIDGRWPVVFAYEPVWAIGTGKTASSQQAQEVHQFIRDRIATMMGPDIAAGVRILYGGSVKSSNAQELFSQPDIDGGLVGGAALISQEFIGILKATLG